MTAFLEDRLKKDEAVNIHQINLQMLQISSAYLKLAQIYLILNASIKDRNGNETYSLDRSKITTQNAPEKTCLSQKQARRCC